MATEHLPVPVDQIRYLQRNKSLLHDPCRDCPDVTGTPRARRGQREAQPEVRGEISVETRRTPS